MPLVGSQGFQQLFNRVINIVLNTLFEGFFLVITGIIGYLCSANYYSYLFIINPMKTIKTLALGAAVMLPLAMAAQDSGDRLVETRAFYSTNAGNGVGKAATITIDGEFDDWTEDMIVATCGANDMSTAFKGTHENCVLDLYAVYAAWDDANLYIAWQMCNTGDTWAREGDGPLTDYGRIGNVPLIVALSVDPSSVGLNGKVKDGRHIWGKNECGVEFSSHIDHFFIMSGQGIEVNAGAAMFTAIDAQGNTEYDNPACCKTFNSLGIKYEMKEGFHPSHLWRQKTTADYDISGTLISDPSIIGNIYDADCYDDLLATPYPSNLKPHDTKFDSFYEMNIPLSALGINREWLESNGIGVRVIATRGESGIDCCPFDPSMMDNVFDSYSADASTTHEKDDIDVITYELASVGKIRTGSVDPLPDPQPTPDPDPTPDPTPDPQPVDGNWTAYFDNTANWSTVKAWVWDANDGNKNYTGGVWPGQELPYDAASGYYRFTCNVTNENPKMMIIFNPGGGNGKTQDLEFVNNGIYNASGFCGTYVSGISSVETENGVAPVYYNLQGVRVDQPASGLYIVVRGNEISKEYVK